MKTAILEQQDLYEENYNIGRWKLIYQIKSFDIKDVNFWINKIKTKQVNKFTLYRDKIKETISTPHEVILQGVWQEAKNNIKKELLNYNSDLCYIWFTYIDMYNSDFIQVRQKRENAKIYYRGQFFNISETKNIENKIYSKLIAFWEAKTNEASMRKSKVK